MPEPGSVTALLMCLQSDDAVAREAAVAALVGRYAEDLLALITARLQHRLRSRVAPEDILQDVLHSFCKRRDGGGYDLADRNQFLSLIVTIAVHKTASAARRELRQCRDVRRERRLEGEGPDDAGPIDALADGGDAPDMAMELSDEIENLLKGLPPECRDVALLRIEGRTVDEIAKLIDRTPRTVERRLEHIRELWTDAEAN